MILFNGVPIEFGSFPNGETLIHKPFFSKNKNFEKNTVTLKYESDIDLFRLLLVRKSLWFPCDLAITYFPYSRMDRNSEEYIFTLKSVAKFINWMEWDSVTIYEPHSDVTPALINKCKVVYLVPKLLSNFNFNFAGEFAVFYPDAGAQKRYSEILKLEPELIGFKKRDFVTGRITDLQILGKRGDTETVVIVDDLCSKGGTFILAAEKLRELGFKNIFLVVGHCEETIFKGEIFRTDLIDGVFTTDSIIAGSDGEPKLTVMQVFIHDK